MQKYSKFVCYPFHMRQVRMDTGNLHWLLHRMYVLGDYKTCQRIIEHQLTATYDHEYLFYVKVSMLLMN